ncbi:SAM-dependent methyltransferase [Pseudanabaena sp. FACHB-1998]|uniref:SAM-dependent methyltransferase n=1 Tax=Pseudanabaena sp. FACHB-1998 TaxID=2692858 RepID=UPI001680817F|nr:SAM-dependent methyltransferase [Pseudanabaena sp. FACHB-1998]MBD2178613.1 SAM-dependent methyltransferase [Pseudanabaena sp. FACHB-1998]
MNRSLLRSKPVKTYTSEHVPEHIPQEIFFCPEESLFYSQCLERMVLNTCEDCNSIVEFGAGDGSPVINSLLKSQFSGLIQGYELNAKSCEVAQFRIDRYKLSDKYVVHNSCFFQSNWQSEGNYLISNPPYLPAINNDLYMPALHGGTDGSSITKQLLGMKCQNAMLMISAYSDPVDTIEYAIAQGYQVQDFITSPMNFGYYSSEPQVRQRISEMHKHGKAFYSSNIYILAGVLFKKYAPWNVDLSSELIKIMTAL